MNDHLSHNQASVLSIMIAWIGAILSAFTLSHFVMIMTVIYTSLQIFILLRDNVFRKKDKQ